MISGLLELVCLAALGCVPQTKRPMLMHAQLYIGKTTYITECAVQNVCTLESIDICAPLEPYPMEWQQTELGYKHQFICVDNQPIQEP
jgi:hypothetical protein